MLFNVQFQIQYLFVLQNKQQGSGPENCLLYVSSSVGEFRAKKTLCKQIIRNHIYTCHMPHIDQQVDKQRLQAMHLISKQCMPNMPSRKSLFCLGILISNLHIQYISLRAPNTHPKKHKKLKRQKNKNTVTQHLDTCIVWHVYIIRVKLWAGPVIKNFNSKVHRKHSLQKTEL